jgi:protein TonB
MPKFAAAPNLSPTVASAPAAVTSVASPALPSRIRVSALSFENYIASKNAVSYPEMAKMQHVEGAVLLDVIVGSDGSLKEVKALSGPTLLRAGAVDAVKRWRFKPYVIDGAPVEVESTISLNFRLNQ